MQPLQRASGGVGAVISPGAGEAAAAGQGALVAVVAQVAVEVVALAGQHVGDVLLSDLQTAAGLQGDLGIASMNRL